MIGLVWMFIFVLGQDGNTTTLVEFEDPGPLADEYVTDPYCFTYSPQGELFIVDRMSARIHVWREKGQYIRSFGRKGQGPGELETPFHIVATEDELWVLELRLQMSVLDHRGQFIRSFKFKGIHPRSFVLLSKDRLITTHHSSELEQVFKLYDGQGKMLRLLKAIEMNRAPVGNKISAFPPEADMQRSSSGHHYFGFSQEKTLYKVDSTGKMIDAIDFELVSERPSDEDRDVVKNMDLLAPWTDRGRLSFKDNDYTFDQDKAYYTHFLVRGDKVTFILTPTGGMWGVGIGFHRATFSVHTMDGTRIATGKYAFPADSMVLFDDGRSILFYMNPEGDFEIKEIQLNGS